MKNIVDIPARKLASRLFRGFISGRITNDDFLDFEPQSDDPAIHAIWHSCWFYYDDLDLHCLVGKHKLPSDVRKACIRWLLFLHNDYPYVWPEISMPAFDPELRVEKNPLKRFFLMRLREDKVEAFMSAGHYPVWPFSKSSDYREALANPKFMRG